MFDNKQTFLALDIGTGVVRAFGAAVKDGRARHFSFAASGGAIAENIMNAADAVERELGVKFRDAAITGNLGAVESVVAKNGVAFPRVREITETDAFNAICNSAEVRGNPGMVLHLIPLQFSGAADAADGEMAPGRPAFGRVLSVRFNMLFVDGARVSEIKRALMSASIRPVGFYDPIYLLGLRYHQKKRTEIFIDFGASFIKAGVMTDRGLTKRFDVAAPVFSTDEKIRLAVLEDEPMGSDRYVAAAENITRQDVWDEWAAAMGDAVDIILERAAAPGAAIFISGAGGNAEHIKSLILENKGLENITILDGFAAAGSLALRGAGSAEPRSATAAGGAAPRRAPRRGRRPQAAAVLPSVLNWDINNGWVYKMFQNAGIKRLHIDVQDGFYTAAVSGGVPELKKIRALWRGGMQVHLMVDDPASWAQVVMKIGADTIIVQAGTRNAEAAMTKIKRAGRRAGFAISPDFDIKKLPRLMLAMADEIIVLAVAPGPSGQAFGEAALARIRALKNTRTRYRFDYEIIADGGINPETAKLCREAGADAVVSGSFLRNAPDFPSAVAELIHNS
ncbi:MAG: hypothetical protein LBL46_02555 [Rickettsiales bacterium]|nr:hypothetical protein [Rickettsiales bacterium]